MPSVKAASVTLIREDKPFTAAYDGQMSLDADELQYELDVRHRAVVREYIEWGRQRQQRHPLGYQNCESPLGQSSSGQ